MQALAQKTADARWFHALIIALILLTALLVGLETSTTVMTHYGGVINGLNQLILAVFIAEVVIKMTAAAPRPLDYFKDGWNVFDFAIIVVSLLPASGPFATIARLARLAAACPPVSGHAVIVP